MSKAFNISGKAEEIFDVGFRPALIGLGVNYGINVYPKNQRSKSTIYVIVNGEIESIQEFYKMVKEKDIRVKQEDPREFNLSQLEEYDGPDIDWNGHHVKFMSSQMYKGFGEATNALHAIADEFVKLDQKYHVIGQKATSMDEKLGDIGGQLNSLSAIEGDIKELNKNIGKLTTILDKYLNPPDTSSQNSS